MARLNDDWILKGGFALQLRTERARTTQDVDLRAKLYPVDELHERLVRQSLQDIDDYFSFSVERAQIELNLGGSISFRVTARVAGRVFERFRVDVGLGDPIVDPVEYLSAPQLLEFAGVSSSPVPCYPVTQHLAEKLHALVRPRPVESSRVKDLIDILLLAELDDEIRAERLRAAIQAVFEARGDQLPQEVGRLPAEWNTNFNRIAEELGLTYPDYQLAVEAARRFLDPVLAGAEDGVWHPDTWRWERD